MTSHQAYDATCREDAETAGIVSLDIAPGAGMSASVLRFRNFVVVPEARMLLQDGRPLNLGSRAFDLLVILLRRRGQVVPKQAIISFVWPTTVVEESNLRFQMALLRNVLGRDRHLIKTIVGRGYLLVLDRLLEGGDIGPQDCASSPMNRSPNRIEPDSTPQITPR